MKLLLKPVELLYRAVARLRRSLYRSGRLKSRKLPRPVVSIGNIAFGGSGKTPLVITVGRELLGRGYRVAILTRGYGRVSDRAGIVDGERPDLFGDEPVLIARALPQAHVVVGADRYIAATAYLRDHDCDVFLLDDGFQHLQLHRDLDVVIDVPHAPLLREGRAALADADVVVVRDSPGLFRMDLIPSSLDRDGRNLGLQWLRGRKVIAFAGLADNQQFFQTLRSLGADLAGQRSFRDHHRYTSEEMSAVQSHAQRLGAELVTTEKDLVKIDAAGVAVLRVEARLEPHNLFLQKILGVMEPR